MSRVVIVSNRVVSPRQAAQAGGVAVAIADTLSKRDGLWFGWSGEVGSDTGNLPTVEKGDDGISIATVPISYEEYQGYYLGYANSVLWPVFHNRLDLAHFEAGYYALYQEVNRRFADSLNRLLQPDDLIWVHDYHFVLLASALRSLGVRNRIGFFLHIPFPPSQSFLAVPEHLELARALAEYDLIGLQTTTDVGNMIDYLEHGASGRLLPDGRIRVNDRVAEISSFPVGIDLEPFLASNEGAIVAGEVRRIIGVDRLDYTKGLPQKFRGFSRFLQQNERYRNRVTLTQIATPTRESVEAYADIRKELESLSGAINGSYGDLDWIPINYINRTLSRSELATNYGRAQVGLVTPLRDGMNLVAKEYVASQDPADPGVLILSRFAGAAEHMTEALIVNPYNIDEIAAAIRAALEMPAGERRERHGALLSKLRAGRAEHWSSAFLERLARRGDNNNSAPALGHSVDVSRALRRLDTAGMAGVR